MRKGWLQCLNQPVPETLTRPLDIADFEVRQAVGNVCFAVEQELGEAYRLQKAGDGYRITGGETGVLYGAYALIRALKTGAPLPQGTQRPYYPLRMIDC